MKFSSSAFVALAIAVAAPTNAAVVSGVANGTATSVAIGQTTTPLQGDIGRTSAVPVSHVSAGNLHCFSSGQKSAPADGMYNIAQKFCVDNAGKTLQYPLGKVELQHVSEKS
ncbi:hypothetical protein C8R47DRAFT_1216314 [Mycena vitilis]|nr:hypothetical protein C8R47DRAFT_1216314 [Mycena vitilis]